LETHLILFFGRVGVCNAAASFLNSNGIMINMVFDPVVGIVTTQLVLNPDLILGSC